MENNDDVRIGFCLIIALMLIGEGLSYSQTTNPINALMSPFLIVAGFFLVLFAFSPSLGADIISAMTRIFEDLIDAISSLY